jgi:CTP:phosphocholine cytidylyltransferase-like protein
MNIIVLGDKYQKGEKSRGCQALIPYSQRISMLEHQRRNLVKHFKNINMAYVYGLDAKTFSIHNIKYDYIHRIYNEKFADSNYAYSLYKAKDYLNDNCLIIFGDTRLNSVSFNNLRLDCSAVFIDNNKDSELGCVINENIVANIAYDLPVKINDKIFFVTKKDASKILEILDNRKNHNNFIFELITKIIDTDSKVLTNKRIK